MKEGALDNMWRIVLEGIQGLIGNPDADVRWESLDLRGISPGKISHHQCFCVRDTMYLIGG